jgi:glucoamylase
MPPGSSRAGLANGGSPGERALWRRPRRRSREPTSGDRPPGYPGIEPRWTSSAKSGVGTAIGPWNRVWFTISHGILNEVYYPRVDQANTRDLGLIVTSGTDFFSEEKRDSTSVVELLAPGVPGYRLTNSCARGRYRIIKTIVADPDRDAVLQDIRFEPIEGTLADYRVYALIAPHIGNQGHGNTGWVGDYKGVCMLFAERGGTALALACSAGFATMSCGYVGFSDGWQQLHAHNRLVECYARAEDGNIALTGEVDLQRCGGHFVLALALGSDSAEAGQDARAALMPDFRMTAGKFVRGWQHYQRETFDLSATEAGANGSGANGSGANSAGANSAGANSAGANSAGAGGAAASDAGASDEYRLSVAVLRTHEDKSHPGGLIASLSVPWGNHKGDHDLGGYHLVWPRDLVESGGALLAAGHAESARQALHYLMCTQEADGHWSQNMWLDGTPYWNGIQLDETGLPILLADLLRRSQALESLLPWSTVRKAASYIVRNGPVAQQDRWEENGGYSPFTLAVEVAALLAAAELAESQGEYTVARYLIDTADAWNDSIEEWTYVRGTPMAQDAGVDGYYVRIAPRNVDDAEAGVRLLKVKNRDASECMVPYSSMVSPGALALVRFGLRAADDPRIVNTVRVVDKVLRVETRTGEAWHRYNGDGYGEHADGSAYDGTGIGRAWPLLAGERGHYELAAGRVEEAKHMLGLMRAQSSQGGLIPEQIWDAPDIPALELFNGHPSGSAMPLVWAHAEYVKLARSIEDGTVFDMPPQTVRRYVRSRHPSSLALWRFNHEVRSMHEGKRLRIESRAPAMVHWSCDGWSTTHDLRSVDSTLGVWYADLPTEKLGVGSRVVFTFYWPEAKRWEGKDYVVSVSS